MLLVAVGNTTTRKVVGGYLHYDAVAWKYANVVHANLARYGAEDGLAVFQLNVEHSVGQRLDYGAFKLYCVLFAHPFVPFLTVDRAI